MEGSWAVATGRGLRIVPGGRGRTGAAGRVVRHRGAECGALVEDALAVLDPQMKRMLDIVGAATGLLPAGLLGHLPDHG